ncbi:Hypothetical protein SaO55_1080 [Staphylococcus aureus]|nr:Hypothetical protein SaO55_1080 [Staphylococcus aureus]
MWILTKYIVVMYNVYENVIVTQFKHNKVLNRKFFTLFHFIIKRTLSHL